MVEGGWGGHGCLRKCLPSMVRTMGQPRMCNIRRRCWAEALESFRAKSWSCVMGVMALLKLRLDFVNLFLRGVYFVDEVLQVGVDLIDDSLWGYCCDKLSDDPLYGYS